MLWLVWILSLASTLWRPFSVFATLLVFYVLKVVALFLVFIILNRTLIIYHIFFFKFEDTFRLNFVFDFIFFNVDYTIYCMIWSTCSLILITTTSFTFRLINLTSKPFIISSIETSTSQYYSLLGIFLRRTHLVHWWRNSYKALIFVLLKFIYTVKLKTFVYFLLYTWKSIFWIDMIKIAVRHFLNMNISLFCWTSWSVFISIEWVRVMH